MQAEQICGYASVTPFCRTQSNECRSWIHFYRREHGDHRSEIQFARLTLYASVLFCALQQISVVAATRVFPSSFSCPAAMLSPGTQACTVTVLGVYVECSLYTKPRCLAVRGWIAVSGPDPASASTVAVCAAPTFDFVCTGSNQLFWPERVVSESGCE